MATDKPIISSWTVPGLSRRTPMRISTGMLLLILAAVIVVPVILLIVIDWIG